MDQSKLMELINTLTPEEKQGLVSFASVANFNSGRMRAFVPDLLKLCISSTPEHREKKYIYLQLFPDQPVSEGKLEKVMVDAYKVVRNFLLCITYTNEENEFQQTHDFSSILRARKLTIRHDQTLEKLKKIADSYSVENYATIQRKFLCEYVIHESQCFHNDLKNDINLRNTLIALDKYYILYKSALTNRLLLQQKVAKIEVPEPLKVLIDFENAYAPELLTPPFIQLQLKIYMLLRKEHVEASDISMLFEMLLKFEKNLDDGSLVEFYTYLRNICVILLGNNRADLEFYSALHRLYKDNLERGYLHYEGMLHPSRVWAVVTTALMVKDTDWALEFIEKYKDQIIGESAAKENYNINLANYKFHVGAYEECLDLLPASFEHMQLLLHIKRLELKAMYELNHDLFPFKLDSFKMYHSRTSQKMVVNDKYQANVDFANILSQIWKSIPGDVERAEKIQKRLEAKTHISDWHWLMEKAEALKNPRKK